MNLLYSDLMINKKFRKKVAKILTILKNDYGPECTNVGFIPEKHVIWINGGQRSGISREDIIEWFSEYGFIENAIIPDRSYVIITYREKKSAVKFFKSNFGKIHFLQLKGPMFFLYMDAVPDIKIEDNTLPPGGKIHEEFISVDQEKELLAFLNTKEWKPLKQRKVQHYGYEFIYGKNRTERLPPFMEIPSFCDNFWTKIISYGYPFPFEPDQLTVNRYEPGQGIPSHVDTHSEFENIIYIISLYGTIQMEFKRNNIQKFVRIPERSLLILSDEARYAWTHGITTRMKDAYFDENIGYYTSKRQTRISLTFRCIKKVKNCNCEFPMFCDARITNNDELLKFTAKDIETKYVKQTYDNIAQHFSSTRFKPWPKVMNFINEFSAGSFLLDVGCGNGKYFGINPNIFEIGSELCPLLAQICYEKGYPVVKNNCIRLPFKNDQFDGLICIAVLHHLCTLERRICAVKEILRVIKQNGRILIYVWAERQETNSINQSHRDQHNNEPFELAKISEADIYLPIIENNGQNFSQKDILVPWKSGKDIEQKTYLRYYHIFEKDELANLCQQSGGKIIDLFHDMGNWCIILTK